MPQADLPFRPSGLPIDAALPRLAGALRAGRSAVVVAPPGAGKSTVVPLALAAEPWVAGRRILVLEPRRVAARAVARRMAATLGEPLGGIVGYRMRLDTRTGPRTRIEVVTEGVLTRLLHDDPALDGVAAVLFDEFHERSVQADLGLALCLDARRQLETDLRIVAMSATLDGAAVARLLGDAPLVEVAGRAAPVETIFAGQGLPALPGGDRDGAEAVVARLVRRALREQSGDVLVFLPGWREIRRVASRLEAAAGEDGGGPGAAGAGGRFDLQVLHGELPAEQQDAILEPADGGPRRVILATNVAETSVTIPGIRVVVDSGLVRRSAFDPVTGMSRLETRRISRASADQRQGRAGRTGPGVCYRAWSEGAHRSLAAQTAAEMADADLAPVALDLARWGVADPLALDWLDPPPVATFGAARDLLRRLRALGADGALSAHGRAMADLGAHPRLAHLLRVAAERGAVRLGAAIAALLSDRDLLRSVGAPRDSDALLRLDALQGGGAAHAAGFDVDRAALQRLRAAAAQFERQLDSGAHTVRAPGRGPATDDATTPAALLACAYPDRVAQRRPGAAGRFLLANGRGAAFAQPERLAQSPYLVVLDLDDADREARILLAAAITPEEIEAALGDEITITDEVGWSAREQAVVARRVRRLDALVLEERALLPPPADAARAAMLAGVRELGLGALPWTEEARGLQARVAFARRHALPGAPEGGWPDLGDAALLGSIEQWLGPWLEGVTRRSHLAGLPLLDALRARVGHDALRRLDTLAPTHLALPTGSRVRIDYADELAPSASMRMQEVFGLATTPRIGGDVPVTFKLLSPAQRPLQVTRDLASFWRNAYRDVRKDMRGRYPRHYWPEDPLVAEPVRGTRRRS